MQIETLFKEHGSTETLSRISDEPYYIRHILQFTIDGEMFVNSTNYGVNKIYKSIPFLQYRILKYIATLK